MPRVQKPSESLSDAPRRKAALYVRVSTMYQVDKDSLPMQRQDLESYSRLILGIDDYEFFEDAGYSGKNTERPAYQDMMARIRKGEFSHLLVWKIDRISRNLLDFASMYAELKKLNVTFVSRNEQFDTSSAMGEAMLKIILVFAELERNMTSERVTATMISRASNGVWNGGRIPYGYDYDPVSRKFAINENEAAVIHLMAEKYLETGSLRDTVEYMNSNGYRRRSGGTWEIVYVDRIFRSPFYVGSYQYNKRRGGRVRNPEDEWVTVPNHHPAIFSGEESERIQGVLSGNKTASNLGCYKHTHVFDGLVYCARCGAACLCSTAKVNKTTGYPVVRIICNNAQYRRTCEAPQTSEFRVGEFVLNYILNMLNAKREFSEIASVEELESYLLFGSAFSSVEAIGSDGLNEYFNLLSRYGDDNSYVFSVPVPEKKAPVNPDREALKKEKERQERALRRLQDLYLYSPDSMSEKDFISRKAEIVSRLEKAESDLKAMTGSRSSSMLSDEDFVRQASHLLVADRLSNRRYISYSQFVLEISPSVLREYFLAIIDSIEIDSRVVSRITFRNGLSHEFIYKK